MNRGLALATLAAIPVLAWIFHQLGHLEGLRPLTAIAIGLGLYWTLIVGALWHCDGWSLRPYLPPGLTLLALTAFVAACALWAGTAPLQLSAHVSGAVALAALINGTLEEAFWRGALIPRPGPSAQAVATGLFILWHLAPALAMARLDAPGGGVGTILGAAVIAPFLMAARLSSGTAGAGAIAHVLVNFLVFARLAAANGIPV